MITFSGRTQEHLTPSTLLGVNLASGLSAGAIAAFITHPWDVIYVNAVSAHHSSPSEHATLSESFNIARKLRQTHGYRIFFFGAVPRLVKVSLSCAIVISTYEMAKWVLVEEHELEKAEALSGTPTATESKVVPKHPCK